MFAKFRMYDVEFWANEEGCWRYLTVTGPQLKAILENEQNERISYREMNYTEYLDCDW